MNRRPGRFLGVLAICAGALAAWSCSLNPKPEDPGLNTEGRNSDDGDPTGAAGSSGRGPDGGVVTAPDAAAPDRGDASLDGGAEGSQGRPIDAGDDDAAVDGASSGR